MVFEAVFHAAEWKVYGIPRVDINHRKVDPWVQKGGSVGFKASKVEML